MITVFILKGASEHYHTIVPGNIKKHSRSRLHVKRQFALSLFLKFRHTLALISFRRPFFPGTESPGYYYSTRYCTRFQY